MSQEIQYMKIEISAVKVLNDKLDAQAEQIATLKREKVWLKEALIKCRVALTIHVFIDNDARAARDNADDVLSKVSTEGK